MTTTISHTLIKSMLISTPGSQVNNFNVGSWWFGKSLFYRDFNNGKENVGHDLYNLTEICESIQCQLTKWKLISYNCDCDRDCSNQFTNIVYKLVRKNQDKLWASGMPQNIFSIPVDKLDDFVSLLWFAATTNRDTISM